MLRSSRLMRGDHPRSRGVYRGEVEERLLGRGSSPLARGLPRPGRGPRRAHEDHPRSRGVYLVAAGLDVESLGSSPLARGLQYAVMPATLVSGIIPARAGFTQHRPAQGLIRADHPRSRGVYAVFGAAWRQILGSSPLARGLRPSRGGPRHPPGIIPARAGFTLGQPRLPVDHQDHPRSRGVYHAHHARLPVDHGSSPLARGLRVLRQPGGSAGRIIPARAGFTGHLGWELIPLLGSSPLARGLHPAAQQAGDPAGIIPARAGFTQHAPARGLIRADHPRSRGVYRGRTWRSSCAAGSSPLARGLRSPTR